MCATEDIRERLRSDFCPPIDEAVLYAICSDYQLGNQEARSACLRNLEIIKAAALEADTRAFDASGTGGFVAKDPDTYGGSESSHNDMTSGSQEFDTITAGLSDLAWEDPSTEGRCLDDAGEDVKTGWLKVMFPGIAADQVSYRLRKCNGNLTRTVDELLNISFIDRTEPGGQSAFPKGIDGFNHLEDYGHERKRKRKHRVRGIDCTRPSSTTSADTNGLNGPKNVWTSMADDVEFICARTNLDAPSVRSLYNAQNRSLALAISSIASNEAKMLGPDLPLDSLTQIQLAELRGNFPAVPDPQLYGLLVICGNVPAAAHELAAAMVAAPKPENTGAVQLITRYAPIDLSPDVDPGDSRSLYPLSQVNPLKAQKLALAKAVAGTTAFSQASNAYRRGKSDHLMGGAAAYYADMGRENIRLSKELSERAAESLVISQSTPNLLDLHGVSVADAVRITKEQVASWWQSLGDTKYAGGGGGPAREGYRVVTGMGRHSRDGAPKIGPAVSRMLVREGWKVTVGQGEILVTGKARRS